MERQCFAVFFFVGIFMATLLIKSTVGQDPVLGFRNLFTRYSDKRLSSVHAVFTSNTTLDACSTTCITETSFQCKSFSYDNIRRSCFLYSVNLNDRDVHLIDLAGRDHYETSYLNKFTRLPSHEVQVLPSQLVHSVSAEECARRCLLELHFKCRGFNYRYREQQSQCQLVESTPAMGSVPAMLVDGNDFYQKQTETALSNFINYGMGRLRPTIESDVYQKFTRGVGVEGCAQLCLEERSFKCISFDYLYEDHNLQNVCYLSQYLAANVHGLVIDSVNPRHNHFEIIERYLNYFYATPYALIQGNNLKSFSKVTPNRCARLCMEEDAFVCRSFDYRILPEATCLLSSKTYRDVGGLDTASGLKGAIHHFEMKPLLDCGGNLTEPDGGIASPNWPRNYGHHENCIWNIQVSQHKIIHLRFTHFELGFQSSDSCSDTDDRILITESGFRPYCIMPNTKKVVTKTNEVTLQFISNAQVDAQGFRAFYSAEWTCDVYLREAPGEFASPKWPANYPSGSRCSWRITAPEGQRVRIVFTSFALELHTLGHCNEKFDNVRILDGGTIGSPPIGLYCGLQSPFTILSSGRDIFVQFLSDNDPDSSRQGFHATFTFETMNGTVFDKDSRYIDFGGGTEEWEGTEEEDTHLLGVPIVGSDKLLAVESDSGSVSTDYRATMWTIMTCLMLIIVVLAIALLLVIRHYRQKLNGQQEKIVEDGESVSAVESVPLHTFQQSFRKNQQFNNLVNLSGGCGSSALTAAGDEDKGLASCACASSLEGEEKLPSPPLPTLPCPPPRSHRPHSSYGKYHEDNLKNINIQDKTQA